MNGDSFYSPYQFIAVTGRLHKPAENPGGAPTEQAVTKTAWDAIKDGQTQVRHDGWQPGTLSGRLLCRLTTVTPTLVGAEQQAGEQGLPGTITNYRIGGALAIPASSLRGAIGAVAEAISQSAMRVLDQREFSVRKGMKQGGKFVSRREPVPGDLHGAFERAGGVDTLPLSPRRKDGLLTPAECLLGVVEDGLAEQDPSAKARNLASRVRFSDALGLEGLDLFYEEPVPLRQLQSPKPPSPAMYFRAANGGAVRKQNLDLNHDVPNGRKHYLVHEPREVLAKRPWETHKLDKFDYRDSAESDNPELLEYAEQGGRYGNPLKDGQELWFHVDFDNLTQAELDLLYTAIDPGVRSDLNPNVGAAFHHRLGWGRPVGLGVLRIAIEGLFLMSRANRYTSKGLTKPRYLARYLGPIDTAVQDQLRSRYPEELASGLIPRLPEDRPMGSELIDRDALIALLRLGDLESVGHRVCYPYANGQQPDSEEDGFQWFVQNDRTPYHAYQYIKPVPQADADADGNVPCLPTLKPG